MSTDEVVVAFSTVGSLDEAKRIAQLLVEERLAACVNIIPGVISVYRWQGRVSEDGELLLLMKTRREIVDAMRERLHELHSYEVPEFIAVPIDRISAQYAQWLIEATSVD